MSTRAASVLSGSSDGRKGPRRPRSPPSMYVAVEGGSGKAPKPLMKLEPKQKIPKKPKASSNASTSPGIPSRRNGWPSSHSLSTVSSDSSDPPPPRRQETFGSSTGSGKSHSSKQSLSSLFSLGGLKRKGSASAVSHAPAPAYTPSPVLQIGPTNPVAPWESPSETTFPSHPAVTPRSHTFGQGSSYPVHAPMPQRYGSPEPPRYQSHPLGIHSPPSLRSMDSFSSMTSSRSEGLRSDTIEEEPTIEFVHQHPSAYISEESIIDIKPVKVARKAPPPITLAVSAQNTSPHQSQPRSDVLESPTTPRVILTPREDNDYQAVRAKKSEPYLHPPVVGQTNGHQPTYRRKSNKDGWSGEWNNNDMQDVISRLRTLK